MSTTLTMTRKQFNAAIKAAASAAVAEALSAKTDDDDAEFEDETPAAAKAKPRKKGKAKAKTNDFLEGRRQARIEANEDMPAAERRAAKAAAKAHPELGGSNEQKARKWARAIANGDWKRVYNMALVRGWITQD